jgi:hypothetical protein
VARPAPATGRTAGPTARVTADLQQFLAKRGRILASYLMPTRVDWVDADCAEAAA